MYDEKKPRRMMEVTDPERSLFRCMKGEYGPFWYVLAWTGGLTLPTLLVIGMISILLH